MSVKFQDYYSTLGVSREASPDDIKKAFRKLARKYHPDIAEDKSTAEEKFKEINEAYEVLHDPEKRRKYDRLGARWQDGDFQPPPGSHSQRTSPGGGATDFEFDGTGFSDFFEQFFGGAERHAGFDRDFQQSQRGGFSGGTFPRRGNDIEGDILVTLAEVFGGSSRTVSLKRANPTTGQTETSTIKVKIPTGVRNGQTIRVRGKGGDGIDGGQSGDLFLHVRIAAHPDFRIQGSDLYYDLDLAPWEAVLGTKIVVPMVIGSPINLRIPPHSNNSQQLRIRGQGLPKAREGDRGDLYVVLNVQLPKELTEEEKALWQKLSEVSSFQAR